MERKTDTALPIAPDDIATIILRAADLWDQVLVEKENIVSALLNLGEILGFIQFLDREQREDLDTYFLEHYERYGVRCERLRAIVEDAVRPVKTRRAVAAVEARIQVRMSTRIGQFSLGEYN